MAWSTFMKIGGGVVGNALAGATVDRAVEAVLGWRDEIKACETLSLLFHQAILDENGLLPQERQQVTISHISFTATRLRLSGLLKDPVYHVEVVNQKLSGDNPKRVRYFGYNTGNYEFWLERPFRLSAPPVGWRVMWPHGRQFYIDPRLNNLDSDWFVVTLGLSPPQPIDWIPIINRFVDIHRINQDHKQNVRALERIRGLLLDGDTDTSYQISMEHFPVHTENTSLWLTPLRSIVSEKALLYHVVAVNKRLPDDHPIRTLAFFYSNITRDLKCL